VETVEELVLDGGELMKERAVHDAECSESGDLRAVPVDQRFSGTWAAHVSVAMTPDWAAPP